MRQQCQLCARRRSPAAAINRVARARARLYAVINCAAWRACVSGAFTRVGPQHCTFGPGPVVMVEQTDRYDMQRETVSTSLDLGNFASATFQQSFTRLPPCGASNTTLHARSPSLRLLLSFALPLAVRSFILQLGRFN